MKIKVAVLFGGQSTEHEVSRVSASSVLNNIDKSKYEVYPIGITKDGKWFEYSGSYEKIASGEWEHDELCKTADGQKVLFGKKVDVVFPVLHGLYGEDGTVQGIAKLLKIPCVGCSVLSSAICMDKVYSKYIFDKFNIKTADYVIVIKHDYEKESSKFISEIEKKLKYPIFIKPSNSGSSVGITKAHNTKELEDGMDEAFKYDRKVLVETGINAKEVEVAVLGNEEPAASVPGEIVPAKEFYDYEAKYSDSNSKLLIPADLTKEKQDEIRNTAIRIFKILDCAGMARIDFLVDKNTLDIYANEVNTIPGFTSISMYPKLWSATGIGYANLIDQLIKLAILRSNN